MHNVTKVMAEARETLEKCQATLTWIRSEAEQTPDVGILAFARAEPMTKLIRTVNGTLAAFPADWPEAIGMVVRLFQDGDVDCYCQGPGAPRADKCFRCNALAKLEGNRQSQLPPTKSQ